MKISHSASRLQREQMCFLCAPVINSAMAKYHKEITQILALGTESFEDELKRIMSNTFHLDYHTKP